MIRESYINLLLKYAKRQQGWFSRSVALAFGSVFFLAIAPWWLISYLPYAAAYVPFSLPRTAEQVIFWVCITLGLFWMWWGVRTQLTIGGGTPAPNVPPQKLIIKGPYRYSRNPIQLGVTLYYLALGTWFKGMVTGILTFLVAFLLGACYHKLVEEEELRRRFGEPYEEYRKKTPFIIPRFKR